MWRHFLWIFWRFSGWVSLILTFFMYTMLHLVTHSCLTLWNPKDCSLPGSSVHEDSPGKNTGVCFHALLQGIFPIQESNPGIFHCRWILYHPSHQGSPFMYTEHLKLAIQLLSPLLLPRVHPKADQGPWGYFRLKFMPQFMSSLLSSKYSYKLLWWKASDTLCACILPKLQWLLSKKSSLLFWPFFVVVQSLSCVQLFDSMVFSMPGFPLLHQLTLLLKLMSIESMMPSNYLILCHPLLLLPSVFPSIRVFSNESVLCIRWPKYWTLFTTANSNRVQSHITNFWQFNLKLRKKRKRKNTHLFWSEASILDWCLSWNFPI